ncbi:MAG: hypothetical protein IKU72_02620 [Oscillospiraceae bacterium]|nr:hypothetical protein [Oscillospiraceae bacterium]
MKRTLTFMLAVLMAVSLLTGCIGTTVVVDKDQTNESVDAEAEATAEATAETTVEADAETEATADAESSATEELAEGELKLGLAIAPSISGSKSATAEENGKADFDVTVVAVLVDGKGIIRDCIIDSVGASANFDATGKPVDFDPEKAILTKNELGENYGMKAYAGAKYEWNEQAAALADFAVGKTTQELKTGAVNEAGKAADADLASVATIYIGSYVSTIEKAVANAKKLGAADGDELKLAVINAMSAAAVGEKDGSVELTVDAAAVSMNGETITSCYIDALQAKVSFDAAGNITNDVSAAPQTKNELGEGYGMKAYAGAKYEWNEQAANFASYITGKTAADVAGIAITETTKPADGTDLAASVTITIGGFQALIAKIAQ